MKSKIPLLKQKSLHDIKPKRTERRYSLKNGATVGNHMVDNHLKFKEDLRPIDNNLVDISENSKGKEFVVKNFDIKHEIVEVKSTTNPLQETLHAVSTTTTNVTKESTNEKTHSNENSKIAPNFNTEIPDSTKMVQQIQKKPKDNEENEFNQEITVLREKLKSRIKKLDSKDNISKITANKDKKTTHTDKIKSETDSTGTNITYLKERELGMETTNGQIVNSEVHEPKELELIALDATTINSDNFNKKMSDKSENVPITKGKINKIISRLISNDGTEVNEKKEYVDTVPVKKSVSSKIAMFEVCLYTIK